VLCLKIFRAAKEILCLVAFFILLFVFIAESSRILTPRRYDFGAMWSRFVLEERNSIEVVHFGSSLAYCNIRPDVFYQVTGKTNYTMAGPLQNIPTTYFYVREMYRTQSPSLITVELTGMFFPEVTDFNLINIGYMPFNRNRILATFFGAERDEWLSLLLPPYMYKGRIFELTREDFAPHTKDPLRGYTYLNHVMENATLEEREVIFSQSNYDNNLRFLKRILRLAERNESEVFLYITASYRRVDEWYLNMLITDLENSGFDFWFTDFNKTFDNIGINPKADFFDTAHFNFNGAYTFTHYFSNHILQGQR